MYGIKYLPLHCLKKGNDMENENKYYVTASDRIWKDKMITVCGTLKRAKEIEELWKRSSDKKHVNIRYTKPYYKGRQVWYNEELDVIKEIY